MDSPSTVVATEMVTGRNGERYLVALMPSSSNPNKFYRTDATNGRCDCPGWKFKRVDPATGHRPPCTHLKALGWVAPTVQQHAPVEKVKASPKAKVFPTLTPKELDDL